MGLLTQIANDNHTTRKPTDDVLLFHALLLMVAADGHLDPEETVSLEAFYATVPDFKGRSFRELFNETVRLARRGSTPEQQVALLADLSTEALRKKCFLLAADIALASGDVDQHEDALLEKMQQVLQIPDDVATQILSVLAIKYAI